MALLTCPDCGLGAGPEKSHASCPARRTADAIERASRDRARRDLMAELGMPPDAMWREVVMSQEDPGVLAAKVRVGYVFGLGTELTFSSWAGDGQVREGTPTLGPYTVEYLGMQAPWGEGEQSRPWPPPWPYWSFKVPGRVFVVQLWRKTIRYRDSKLYGEVRWKDGGHEKKAIKGVEHAKSLKEVERAYDGLVLLEHLPRESAGQGHWTKANLMAEIEKSIRRTCEQKKIPRHKVTKKNVADGLSYSVDWIDSLCEQFEIDFWAMTGRRGGNE